MKKFVSQMYANVLNILHVFILIGLFILHETLSQTTGSIESWLVITCVVFAYVFFVGFLTTIITIKETLHSIEDTLKEFKSNT